MIRVIFFFFFYKNKIILNSNDTYDKKINSYICIFQTIFLFRFERYKTLKFQLNNDRSYYFKYYDHHIDDHKINI